MKWGNRRQSDNIDDRRESSSGGGGVPSFGAIGMIWPLVRPLLATKFGWIIIAVGVVAYMSGFNPLSMLGMGGQQSFTQVDKTKDDKQAAFMATVLADTEDVWRDVLAKEGMNYVEPKVVLYRGGTSSACGSASSQMGPFYCPLDQKVYLDLSFFDELSRQFKAPGDFAQAYVLAHEIGHHVQHLEGTLDKVHSLKQRLGSEKKANALQVNVELQADCYSGVWAYHAHKRFNILEQGDVEEALNAANAIGDDMLQKKSQGYVVPDAFTHGSSADRIMWFKKGLESGNMKDCDTFSLR